MQILTHELKLATLYDLQVKYSVEDLYDLLEVQDVYSTVAEEAKKTDK